LIKSGNRDRKKHKKVIPNKIKKIILAQFLPLIKDIFIFIIKNSRINKKIAVNILPSENDGVYIIDDKPNAKDNNTTVININTPKITNTPIPTIQIPKGIFFCLFTLLFIIR